MNALQGKLLGILSYFHKTCAANGLSYYAAYGTLLGAIRHNGFIPWDDDMDVWMPRPDYDKLLAIADQPPYRMEAPGRNGGDYYYPAGKLYDTSTTAVEITKFPVKKGVFLDVFPLDGLGDTRREAERRYWRLHFPYLLAASRLSVPRKGRSALKNCAIRLSSLIPEALFDTRKFIARADGKCRALPYAEKRYAGVPAGNFGTRDVFDKALFGAPVLHAFESIQIFIPSSYDRLLTDIYGDWRTPPPPERRTSGHDFAWIDLNRPYLE